MTTPKGDLFKEVNSEPFKLTCHLNPEDAYYKDNDYRSGDLRMYYDLLGGERVFLEPTLLNSSAMEVTFDPSVQGHFRVNCVVQLRGTAAQRGVCSQIVYVGGKIPAY